LDWIKMTVVVEKGGYLAVDNGPAQIMKEGWDLKCLPGSSIWEKGEEDKGGNADYEKREVTETRTWSAPSRDLDYLVGVKELFQEMEEVSKHANGGKHKKNTTAKMERVLWGFDPCGFIGSDGVLLPLLVAFS